MDIISHSFSLWKGAGLP